MDRKEIIERATRYELEWFLENPEHLTTYVDFFTNGGFANMTDEQLQKECADMEA